LCVQMRGCSNWSTKFIAGISSGSSQEVSWCETLLVVIMGRALIQFSKGNYKDNLGRLQICLISDSFPLVQSSHWDNWYVWWLG
jgi:hypothetical protein